MADSLVPTHNPSLGPISPAESQYTDRAGRSIGPRDSSGAFRPRRNPGTSLLWYGEAVEGRIAAAAMVAVKEIAEAAAAHARENHPWRNQSGETEASVFVGEPEITSAGVVRCFWGAGGAAIYLEYGTIKMPAYPFLRPAQDATYPHLAALTASRIRL